MFLLVKSTSPQIEYKITQERQYYIDAPRMPSSRLECRKLAHKAPLFAVDYSAPNSPRGFGGAKGLLTRGSGGQQRGFGGTLLYILTTGRKTRVGYSNTVETVEKQVRDTLRSEKEIAPLKPRICHQFVALLKVD
jgi:hypothetical protein